MLRKIFGRMTRATESESQLSDYERYLQTAYPSNHTYQIQETTLKPYRKLAARHQALLPLYPTPLTSFLDISCAKGFFVFHADMSPTCKNALGIDVNAYNITVCDWVKEKIHAKARFESLRLHELAMHVDQYDGPFQTILIINAYQYLYFGSDEFPEAYLDHDTILQYLNKICTGRIIFNNRIQLENCQNKKCISASNVIAHKNYNEKTFLQKASQYFTVKSHGKIGKYPLFTLDAR